MDDLKVLKLIEESTEYVSDVKKLRATIIHLVGMVRKYYHEAPIDACEP